MKARTFLRGLVALSVFVSILSLTASSARAEGARPASPAVSSRDLQRAALFARLWSQDYAVVGGGRPVQLPPDVARPLGGPGGFPALPTPAYAEGSVLVTFRAGVSLYQAARLVRHLGYGVLGTNLFDSMRILVLEVPVGAEQGTVDQLVDHPLVEAASLNRLVTIL